MLGFFRDSMTSCLRSGIIVATIPSIIMNKPLKIKEKISFNKENEQKNYLKSTQTGINGLIMAINGAFKHDISPMKCIKYWLAKYNAKSVPGAKTRPKVAYAKTSSPEI